MATLRLKPSLHHHTKWNPRSNQKLRNYSNWNPRLNHKLRYSTFSGLNCIYKRFDIRSFSKIKPGVVVRASSTNTSVEEAVASDVLFTETFQLKRSEKVEGKISVRVDHQKDDDKSQVAIGCNLPGKWVLHWGVTYYDDVSSEWDQPPPDMRPPDSIAIKDYAIETPLKKSPLAVEGNSLYEVQIDIKVNHSVGALHFVLKDEETGAWYQHRGRDFRVCLLEDLQDENDKVGDKKSFSLWPGDFVKMPEVLLTAIKREANGQEPNGDGKDARKKAKLIEEFYDEYIFMKEKMVGNYLTVSVQENEEKNKALVLFDTDLPGNVIIHWGVCRDNGKKWEIPQASHPPSTNLFRKKALQTSLQFKENGGGSWGLFTLDKELAGLLFVLKLDGYTWLNNNGSDFYIPLSAEIGTSSVRPTEKINAPEGHKEEDISNDVKNDTWTIEESGSSQLEKSQSGANSPVSRVSYTDEIINEIRSLVSDISSERSANMKSKDARESILQEIEKLAAEAYSIFRSSIPTFLKELVSEPEIEKPQPKICSGTGTGYEVLCQGFNWESHKSGRWYSELYEKAADIVSLGFTVIWLPPPTESVSPEGYMPKDLYNLNSRYGTIEELKTLVRRFHEVGIKVLGDAVLNHRCAHYKNQNGVWNIFGGRLNWDDRAIVADDPHFQGRGNKSSGDNFHAAPNIDHSQDFVRNDLKEWLNWLRNEIGYDGWRLDFVRGFWGGYVKDYLDATEPYFAVGEYWDSLSYTYGEMDHNQDAHRQRIIDWINATNGTAGAFDVTTKGILHSALGKCEYWRLSDQKGKPPGVVGWWPSRAVTFIENHDTGSTQGHWRFPSGKEMQGYAYILTHPGTPAVFYDHIFSHYRDEISALIGLRHRKKINCRSTVEIRKAERDVYAATIDDRVTVKIGPGHYEPPSGSQNWSLIAQGQDYKVWEVL
ncbi:hypothetical protein AMTRI_Chr05g65370 [Amborella trichopoda]